MPEETLPSEEEIERGKQAIDTLNNLTDILRENLGINRKNTDEIKKGVLAAKDLAAPFELSSQAANKINKASRDLSSLSSEINNKVLERTKYQRTSKDISEDIKKSISIEKSLLSEKIEIDKQGIEAVASAMNSKSKEGKAAALQAASQYKSISDGLAAQLSQTGDINKALAEEADQEHLPRQGRRVQRFF